MSDTRPKFPKFTKKRAPPPTEVEDTSEREVSMSAGTLMGRSIVASSNTEDSETSPLTPLPTSMTQSPAAQHALATPRPPVVTQLKRTHFGPVPVVCGPWHGKVASHGPLSGFVFTTPTELYVPQVPKDVDVIHTFIDGRWGVKEYSRHPQWHVPEMTHIACIPRRSSPPLVPEILFETLQAAEHWEEDPTIAVHGLGRIRTEVRQDLSKAANTVIDSTTALQGKDQRVLDYRMFLVMLLRQVLTRLAYLPAVPSRAIAVTAHVQRLSLELVGLKTYLEVVVPRMESADDFSRSGLEVVGAFLRDATAVQTWHRVGLPYWYLQPLANHIVVYDVVKEQALPYELATTQCDPPILHRAGSFVGVCNLTGNWVNNMVLAMSKHIAGSHLSSLDLVCLPDLPVTLDSSNKRTRGNAKEIVGRHLHMRPAADTPVGDSKGTRRRNGRQGGHGAPPDRTSGTSNELTHQPSPETDATLRFGPSRTFVLSPFIDISDLWAEALREVSPLPQTPNSALYFFPPPFLLDTVTAKDSCPPACPHPQRARVDTKVNRYIHNLLRIREFCRICLFDVSLENRPLSISEWRAALWGEYSPQASVRSGGEGSEARRAKRRLQERNAVGALFHKVAHMDVYSPDTIVQYDGREFDLQSSSSDVALRQSLLWESHEVNFRAELLALDTILVHKKDWPEISRWEREMLVSGIWGMPTCGATVVADTAKEARSFGWYSPPDMRWETCRDRLRRFAVVLTRWPGCPEAVIQAGKRDPDEACFGHIQRQAVHFYVRTFASQYARLPVPPVLSL